MARTSSDDGDAFVVGWENRRGTHYSVYDANLDKQRRNPTDRSLEKARRVIVYEREQDRYLTLPALTADYTIDDALAEIEDHYSK